MKIKRYSDMVLETAKIVDMPELDMDKVAKVAKYGDEDNKKYYISLFDDIDGIYRFDFNSKEDIIDFAKKHNLLK